MQERINKREEAVEEFDPIINARNYHNVQMLKKILDGMSVHVSNVFDEIENVYSSGYQISQNDIEELIRDIRRDIDAIDLYLN